MNRSQRIHIGTGNTITDKYIHVKLEKDTDTLEFLSLKIDTKDVYNDFNADYGVIVGRVIANGGVGVPNAKISIFIPLDEGDENNSKIVSVYPYTNPRDKNNQGKRYNLLPRVSRIDPATDEIKPPQAFGSFPTKEEIITNSTFLEVYKKYYKFSTVTNNSGDYMIFGVPTGTQTVHMSVDITDIGQYSMTPAAMVTNLGYSPNLFIDNNTRIKPSDDLDDLPNIETQEVAVDVIPFWGDNENFEIGITRQDFRIRAEIVNSFVIFGSVFTDGDNAFYGEGESKKVKFLYRATNPLEETIGIATKRIGVVTENIYYYPPEITDEQIDNGDVDSDVDSDVMLKLDSSQYSIYKRDGDFIFIINCNRRKVITNELGEEEVVDSTTSEGVFTRFRGFITLEISDNSVQLDFSNDIDGATVRPLRYKIKIPQSADKGRTFKAIAGNDIEKSLAEEDNKKWRKQEYTFSGGNFYSVAKFYGLVRNETSDNSKFRFEDNNFEDGFFQTDSLNDASDVSGDNEAFNTGIIQTNGELTDEEVDDVIDLNAVEQFPYNHEQNETNKYFGGNWMNFALYLMQNGRLTEFSDRFENMKTNTNFTYDVKRNTFINPNSQPIAAGDINTQHFARSDLHFTDFIRVPKQDITTILRVYPNIKGFKSDDIPFDLDGITEGYYKNGEDPCPLNGGKENGNPSNGTDTNYYFYRGLKEADCISYLREIGLI